MRARSLPRPFRPESRIFRAHECSPVSDSACSKTELPARQFRYELATSLFPQPVCIFKTSKMPNVLLSSSEFRKGPGHFTTWRDRRPPSSESPQIHGMTANSFTSVSLDPKLVLVCVDHRANMYSVVAKEKTVWRQRPETKSAGHLRIFRKARTNAKRAAAGIISAGAQRRSRHRGHAAQNEFAR